MKKDRYIYPAIFSYAADGITIEFPDLPGCLPCGKTNEEALKNAKEAMALHLWGIENDNEPIPEPTSIDKIELKPNQIAVLVEVFMPVYREALENQDRKSVV